MGQPVHVRGALGRKHHVVVGGPPVMPTERGEISSVLGHEVERSDAIAPDGGVAPQFDSKLVDAAGLRSSARLQDGGRCQQICGASLVLLPHRPQLLPRRERSPRAEHARLAHEILW